MVSRTQSFILAVNQVRGKREREASMEALMKKDAKEMG